MSARTRTLPGSSATDLTSGIIKVLHTQNKILTEDRDVNDDLIEVMSKNGSIKNDMTTGTIEKYEDQYYGNLQLLDCLER